MDVYGRYFNVRPRPIGFDTGDVSRTKQEFKDECDINRIMAKYVQTGVLPGNVAVGRYGDFSAVGSYQEALATVFAADAQFQALPAEVRDEFGNSPARFLAAVADPSQKARFQKLGLLVEEPKAEEAVGAPADKPPVT